MLLLISLACLHFLVLFIYLFIYLAYLLSYTSPLQHSSTRLSSTDSFSAALVWGLLCCKISLLGKRERFLQVNENAVSVKKFTDHENPSLIERIDLMTSYFFLLLSVAFKLYPPFHATSVIKANFRTLFQWAVQ